MGQVQYVEASKNVHKCDRCGDILPDAKALRHHKASGFCRPVKTEKEQRQLRVGRYLEAKAKAVEKAKLVAQPEVATHEGVAVKAVGVFRYLGTQMANNATTGVEVTRRTNMARNTVKQLRKVWQDASLPRHLKAALYGSLVSSVALYNAECWRLSESDWKTVLPSGGHSSAPQPQPERVSQQGTPVAQQLPPQMYATSQGTPQQVYQHSGIQRPPMPPPRTFGYPLGGPTMMQLRAQ
eukprot:g18914.t1